MPTQDEKIITEEQIKKDDERYKELNSKKDRTQDDEKELGELKERHGRRMQERIDKLSWRAKAAEEREAEALEKAEKLEAENAELKRTRAANDKSEVVEEFVEIGGKKYYSDNTLISMVKEGKISENEAYKYQRSRDREEDRLFIEKKFESQNSERKMNEIRIEDAQRVNNEFPHFNKNHPDFNPEDPHYKLTSELYAEAYVANPKGLSMAARRAAEILKIRNIRIDRSPDLSVEDTHASETTRKKEKEFTLSEQEKEAAERMYRDILNPKTGRTYTVNESHARALEAKKARTKKED